MIVAKSRLSRPSFDLCLRVAHFAARRLNCLAIRWEWGGSSVGRDRPRVVHFTPNCGLVLAGRIFSDGTKDTAHAPFSDVAKEERGRANVRTHYMPQVQINTSHKTG